MPVQRRRGTIQTPVDKGVILDAARLPVQVKHKTNQRNLLHLDGTGKKIRLIMQLTGCL
jgi:hypothetical protein